MPDTLGPLAGRCILVVEDDYLIASEMDRTLRRAGAVVVGPWPGVAQALVALDALATSPDGPAAPVPDAAVLDVNLADGETVYPVAERLDRLGVPYLFATGNVPSADDPAYRDRPRLEKPVSDRLLLRAIATLLPGRR